VDDERIALGEEMAGHGFAHHAKPNEPDGFHFSHAAQYTCSGLVTSLIERAAKSLEI
jgi:hypothetical protein